MLVYLKHAFLANRKYLLKRPHIVPGLLVGIFVNELGILTGIYKSNHPPAHFG